MIDSIVGFAAGGPPAPTVAAVVAGLARGFSGFGAALIFMPLASASLGGFLAAPMLLLMDSIPSLGLLPNAWRLADRREVGVMMLGVLVGGPMGAVALAIMPPLALRWSIVALVFALLCLLMSGWRYHGPITRRLSIGVGWTAGILSGAAQVGGPPVVAYWLGRALPPERVRANLTLFFLSSSVVSALSYALTGALNANALAHAAIAMPIYGLGVYLGAHAFGRASVTFFRHVCHGLILLAAILGMPLLDPYLR